MSLQYNGSHVPSISCSLLSKGRKVWGSYVQYVVLPRGNQIQYVGQFNLLGLEGREGRGHTPRSGRVKRRVGAYLLSSPEEGKGWEGGEKRGASLSLGEGGKGGDNPWPGGKGRRRKGRERRRYCVLGQCLGRGMERK